LVSQRVHRAIARPDPPHTARADRAARELLILSKQLAHHLPRGPQPPPQLKHPLDRVPDLRISGEGDQPGLVAIQPDGKVHLKLPALGLVPQPAIEPGADQVQLGLGHRALQAEQQPIVEIVG
jgi:hypothetical protein